MKTLTNYEEILSIEVSDSEDVYDLTVEDNHNFFANDLLVHNCGEIPLSPYDSCRLMVMNLTSFVLNSFTKHARFDYERFSKVVMKAQRLMDDLVDLEVENIDRIIEKIKVDPEPDYVKAIELNLWNKIREAGLNGRRTGLGITGLGDALAALGIRYGSKESVEATEDIYKALASSAHISSINLASERGAFPVWNYEKERNHDYLNKVLKEASKLDPDVLEKWQLTGRRNIALTTTAPVGSVSILTQTTSGIEPAYLLSYKRRRKITQGDINSRVDFVDDLGDKWQEYTVYHHHFKKWMDVSGETDVEKSPYWKATANDIDWETSVDVQAAAQRWIDHSISKTCNLPNDATREIVNNVYMKAWKTGCKGFTVYRDGSRTGVLVSSDEKQHEQNQSGDRIVPKRPKTLSCDIHHANVRNGDKSESWLVLVGMNNGKPYEVFCGIPENIEVHKRHKSGFLTKNGKKQGVAAYSLLIQDGNEKIVFKDIVTLFDNPTQGAFSRTISLALRHGVPLHYIVEQIQKDKNSDMFSFSKVISRVLKGYIKDGTKSSEKECPNCKAPELVYQEGCLSCKSCGWGKCG